ncbi:putative lipoprotein [Aliivibrio wodanis]|uniref:Putative lipoprotein n=1 Tax=Aliivibrio wodanis TaxID=80852 RepID=A0A090I6Y7_9GAMM|nr:putative lipoprotein [Aliivibrio wodanis]
MNNIFKISLITSAILLAGCGDDTNSSGASTTPQYEDYIQDSLAQDTNIKFNLSGKNISVPIPSFALMDATDGTLGLPTDGNNDLTNPYAAMNTVDGWSTSMPIIMEFEGVGLADGNPQSGVYIIKIDKSLTSAEAPGIEKILVAGTDFDIYSSAMTDSFTISFRDSLDSGSEYILALSNELTDVDNDPVGMSSSYAALKSKTTTYTKGSLAQAQQVTQGVEQIFAGANAVGAINLNHESIIYSTWFSTQSVGASIYSTKAASAAGIGAKDLSLVWKGSANPNNVDLTAAYTMSFETAKDYVVALTEDDDYTTFFGQSNKDFLLTQYQSSPYNGTVNVTQGFVQLPYYLETSQAEWNSQPFESAMPSLAKVSSALSSEADAATIVQQLMAANIDPSLLATDPAEQLKLVGVDLTKADGTVLDEERVITRYAPVPKIKALHDVEFLLFTPKTLPTAGTMPIVIYQHGITSAKENAYHFAANLVNQGIAVIGIDLPLHGTRSLDGILNERSANVNLLAYLNLSNLPVARDNVRQSILDIMGLRASLSVSQGLGIFNHTELATAANTTVTNPRFVGHSLGGITGVSAVAQANKTIGDVAGDAIYKFSSAAFENAGGQIATLLLGSESFGSTIKHTVAISGDAKYAAYASDVCQTNNYDAAMCLGSYLTTNPDQGMVLATLFNQFAYAGQTVLDTIDPFTNASDLLNDSGLVLPVYMSQANSDATVPNDVINDPMIGTAPFSGTEPLAKKLGLNTLTASSNTPTGVSDFAKFNDVAQHSTFIAPQSTANPQEDYNHHMEMQMQLGDFLIDNKLDSVTNSTVLE